MSLRDIGFCQANATGNMLGSITRQRHDESWKDYFSLSVEAEAYEEEYEAPIRIRGISKLSNMTPLGRDRGTS